MTDFTHAGYLRLLRSIQDLGYKVGPLRDFPESGPAVILRHDIDFSVQKALEMAKLDVEGGTRATFFVLLTAPYYNPLTPENIRALQEMAAMGHELGLHYDCSYFEGLSEAQMQERVRVSIQLLELYVGAPFTSIAQHKPSTSKIRPRLAEYRDAYSAAFFEDIAYLSDSRMRFGAPDVDAFFRTHPRSQLLIHPLWWNETVMTREEIFANLVREATAGVAAEADADLGGIQAFLQRLNAAQ
ncbi:MAG TPA: hypothetical protein VEK11_00520 [Thermoanaerobaculia bacterium]|jgi:hypothetical protein|nr:hypothetical protein [Thermoanaerobaculia bacterium]